MAYAYRSLTELDAAPWQELRMEGVRLFPMGFLTTEAEAEATYDQARWILGQGNNRGVFDGPALVGLAGLRRGGLSRIAHSAEIGPFYVTPPHQGQGAARALMDGIIAEARETALGLLTLHVDSRNARAIRFYERCGFARVATVPDTVRIDGEPCADHIYHLSL
ncbi:GNAT family N-acetyltransferase [Tropicibacter naphthalenivorans]|uniref:N-acyltransferase YncA n=1 Tax=Tropicibacter naphthalenivorans TaxID=441103 RepID=A0A0P1G516_9RHOB|nr:GNAT family N-acetyltransferase [Tropicibacter naphthalenivorans]CUH76914.1 N-acyltransferase YncA [Tropicibacter naphthalenivorans]SMC62285.1 Protein N-acetyltransferase, RimJ/RimL family [Tropicibacter naphthalenivorans]